MRQHAVAASSNESTAPVTTWRDRPSPSAYHPVGATSAAAAAAAGLISRPSSFKIPLTSSGSVPAAEASDAPGSSRSSQIGPSSGPLAGSHMSAALSPQPSARALGRMSPGPPLSMERSSGGSSRRSHAPVLGPGAGPGPSNLLGMRGAPTAGGVSSSHTTASASVDTPLVSPMASPLASPVPGFYARTYEGSTPALASPASAFAAAGPSAAAAASLGLRTVSERRIQRLINKIDSVCSNHSAASGAGGPTSGPSSRGSSMHEWAAADRRTSAPLVDLPEAVFAAPPREVQRLEQPMAPAGQVADDGGGGAKPTPTGAAMGLAAGGAACRHDAGANSESADAGSTGPGNAAYAAAAAQVGTRQLSPRARRSTEPQADLRGADNGMERPLELHPGKAGAGAGRAGLEAGGRGGERPGRQLAPAWPPSLTHAFAEAASSLLGGGASAPSLFLPHHRSGSTGCDSGSSHGGRSSCSDGEMERELSARQLVRLATDRSRGGATRLMSGISGLASGVSGTLSSTSASATPSLSPYVHASARGSGPVAVERQRRLERRDSGEAEGAASDHTGSDGGEVGRAHGRRTRTRSGRRAPPLRSASSSSAGSGGGGEGRGKLKELLPETLERASRPRRPRSGSRSPWKGRSRSDSPSGMGLEGDAHPARAALVSAGHLVAHEHATTAGVVVNHNGNSSGGDDGGGSDFAPDPEGDYEATRYGLGFMAAAVLPSRTPHSPPPLSPQASVSSASAAAAPRAPAPATVNRDQSHPLTVRHARPAGHSSSNKSTSSGQEHGDADAALLPVFLPPPLPPPPHGTGGTPAATPGLMALSADLSAQIGARLQHPTPQCRTTVATSGPSAAHGPAVSSSAAAALENAASLVALIDEDLGKAGASGGSGRSGGGGKGGSRRPSMQPYSPSHGSIVDGPEAAGPGAPAQQQRMQPTHRLKHTGLGEGGAALPSAARPALSADWDDGSRESSDGSSGGGAHGLNASTRNRRLSVPGPDSALFAYAAHGSSSYVPGQHRSGRGRSSAAWDSDSSGGIYSDDGSRGEAVAHVALGGHGRATNQATQPPHGAAMAGKDLRGGGNGDGGSAGLAQRYDQQAVEVEPAEWRAGRAVSSPAVTAFVPAAAAGALLAVAAVGADPRLARRPHAAHSAGGAMPLGPLSSGVPAAAGTSLAARQPSSKGLHGVVSFASPLGARAASNSGAPATNNAFTGAGAGAGMEADGVRSATYGGLAPGPIFASPGPASGSSARVTSSHSAAAADEGSVVDIDLLKRDLERLLAR